MLTKERLEQLLRDLQTPASSSYQTLVQEEILRFFDEIQSQMRALEEQVRVLQGVSERQRFQLHAGVHAPALQQLLNGLADDWQLHTARPDGFRGEQPTYMVIFERVPVILKEVERDEQLES